MGKPKAMTCRYCRQPGGKLFHGAHVVCKNKVDRERLRQERGSDPELCWGRDEKCCDCPDMRVGKSPRCPECRKKHKHEERIRTRGEARKPPKERRCKCGCGVIFQSHRSHYATDQCRIRHHAKPRAQRKRRDLSTYATPTPSAKQKLHTRLTAPKIEEPIGPTVNNGVQITKIPPVLRASLRNLFGDERGERWLATDW